MYLMNDSLEFSNTKHFRNRRITIDPWIFERPSPLTKAEITKHLSNLNARYRDVIWNDREVLQMESGVLLDFGPDWDDKQIVCTAICLSFPEFRARVRRIGG
jgi:hypothetical protein